MGAVERLQAQVEVVAAEQLLPGERIEAACVVNWPGHNLVLVAVVLPAFLAFKLAGALLAIALLHVANRVYTGRSRPSTNIGPGCAFPVVASMARVVLAVTDHRILAWSSGIVMSAPKSFWGAFPLGDVVSAKCKNSMAIGAETLVIETRAGQTVKYQGPAKAVIAFAEAINRGLPSGSR